MYVGRAEYLKKKGIVGFFYICCFYKNGWKLKRMLSKTKMGLELIITADRVAEILIAMESGLNNGMVSTSYNVIYIYNFGIKTDET